MTRGSTIALFSALCACAWACSERGVPEVAVAPSAAAPLESADASIDAGDSNDAGDAAIADAASDVVEPETIDAGPPPCPEEMAQIGRYCIDRYEAHLVTAGDDGGLTVFSHVERPAHGVRYEARSAAGMFPQAYISRVEAKAACTNAGKRLCSMREWQRACEGKRSTTYPYGNHGVHGRCNSGKEHLLALRYGSDPRHWKYDENFNDPALDAEPGFLAKGGEYGQCVGADGVYDLVGNLHEWVSDSVDQELVDRLEAEEIERHDQPWKEGNGVFMGGFFSTTDQHGPGCKFTTIAHEPSYHDYSIGFRCCSASLAPAAPPITKNRAGDAGASK